jgi:hypothetical protein
MRAQIESRPGRSRGAILSALLPRTLALSFLTSTKFLSRLDEAGENEDTNTLFAKPESSEKLQDFSSQFRGEMEVL